MESKELFFGFGAEGGKGEVVFEGEDAQEDDGAGAGKLAGHVAASQFKDYPVDECSGETGCGIYVFSEHEWFLIDEDIAYHTAESAGYDTHDRRNPHRIVNGKRLVDTNHAEESQTDTVEDEEYAVATHKDAAEDDDGCQRESCHAEIPPGLHPEDRYIEKHIAECTATDSRNQTHGVGTKPIEVFCRSKAYSGDGTCHCANHLKYK